MPTIESFNPSSGELLGSVPVAGPAEVDAAVALSWNAFYKWRISEYKEKQQLMHQLHDTIVEQKDKLARLISSEVGKPLVESLIGELAAVLDSCTYFSNNTQKLLKDQVVTLTNPLLALKRNELICEPLGAIGIIAPWNYPFAIPTIAMIMALMCGNTVILKPSEKSPLVGEKIADLFSAAGFPPGVVSIIHGGAEVGSLLAGSKLARLLPLFLSPPQGN